MPVRTSLLLGDAGHRLDCTTHHWIDIGKWLCDSVERDEPNLGILE